MSNCRDYLVSYDVLMKQVGLKADELPETIELKKDQLIDVIKSLLRAVPVDEQWYRRQHADVDEAIAAGAYLSAKHHFVQNGYFEGRRTGPIKVDGDWYVQAYPDVAEGIERGDITSAQEHFETFGLREGRFPHQTS